MANRTRSKIIPAEFGEDINVPALEDCNIYLISELSHEKSNLMDAACSILQKLLLQLTWDDAPPCFDDAGRVGLSVAATTDILAVFSYHLRFLGSTSRHKTDKEASTFNRKSNVYDVPSLAQFQEACQKLGHVPLASLCARTLQKLGKPEAPLQELRCEPLYLKRTESPLKGKPNWQLRSKKTWLLIRSSTSAAVAKVSEGIKIHEDLKLRDENSTKVPSVDSEDVECHHFGSEYARYLSNTATAPSDTVSRSPHSPKSFGHHRQNSRNIVTLEGSSIHVVTGAITDLVITYGDDPPPVGYHRVSKSRCGYLSHRDHKSTCYINVKKESSWDRAAQRPCVTSLAIIYPDRREFVPPGFSLVRRHKHLQNSLTDTFPANLNCNGEPVLLCFKRSREGNPITGLVALRPSNQERIPDGYTVIERTPTNFVADIHSGNDPVFLAYRQRLANLETLRPLPLVGSVQSSNSEDLKLQAYYATGGTIVVSDVGRFHIMDRSTHSLLSPSSVNNRLTLIKTSRREALSSLSSLPTGIHNAYSSSSSQSRKSQSAREVLKSSLLLAHGFNGSSGRPTDAEKVSNIGDYDSVGSSSENDASYSHVFRVNHTHLPISSNENSSDTPPIHSSCCLGKDLGYASNTSLQRCLEALSFIPIVSTYDVCENKPSDLYSFQSKVAIITPILTACYTRHGGSTLVAVDGLTTLLRIGFFSSDCPRGMRYPPRLTLLDLSVQVICDVATMGAQETHLQACLGFVESAVRYSSGHLTSRTVGYALRFYLFVFHFATSSKAGSNLQSCDEIEMDVNLLEDPRKDLSDLLACATPQLAALSLKDLISFSIARLRPPAGTNHISKPVDDLSFAVRHEETPPDIINRFLVRLTNEIVDDSVHRVAIANYTQLALHQIHRSGGSELFWYDMMNSCGMGLFGNDDSTDNGGEDSYILCFAILANLVKVATSKSTVRKRDVISRCLGSKMLGLELLHFFLETWRDEKFLSDLSRPRPGKTFAFCVRRLVVPCLLCTTRQCLDESRIYRRVLRIIGILWCSEFYRSQMKLELGILLEHFVLRMLEFGPQLPSMAPEQTRKSSSLLEQQVELLEELNVWFSLGSRDLLELFLNFDTYESAQVSGPIRVLTGTQLNIWERLSASLCNTAEVCGELIGNQIRLSRSTESTQKNTHDSSIEGGSRDRDAAQRIRKAALETIAQMVKCLAEPTVKETTKALPIYESLCISPNPSQSLDTFTRASNASEMESRSGSDSLRDVTASVVDDWRKANKLTQEHRERDNSQVCTSSKIGNGVGDEPSQIYSGITRLQNAGEATGKIDQLGIALDIAKKKGLNKAIDYLIACNVLTTSPRDIASFLRIHKGDLSPNLLGKYLGGGGVDTSHTEFWNSLRFNYIRAISFVGMNIEQGLRHLLTNCGFRLPGEAQEIDRIITTFAQCYWEDNAGDQYRCPLQHQDSVFLLSYAIIMLNTDLHKTSRSSSSIIRKRPKNMTKSEFIANLRGVIRFEELASEYLSEIYDSIEDQPITLQQDDVRNECSDNVTENLQMSITSMLDNVKTVEALLRALAIHDYRFITIEDASELEDGNVCNLARRCMDQTWHQFHGLINAALEIAHLDMLGMQQCVDILIYAICVTVRLDMPTERAAFLNQLSRIRLFNARRRGNDESHSNRPGNCEHADWCFNIERICFESRNRDIWPVLDKLKDLGGELRLSLAVEREDKKTMSDAVRRLQNGEFLLHDPVRYFIREGCLLKQANRSGRFVEYRFFLFSDMLVYARRLGNPGVYKIHGELQLILMKVVDWFPPEMKKESKRAFQIYHPRKKFMVFCSNGKERKSWVREIRAAIDKELERKVAIEGARAAAAKSH